MNLRAKLLLALAPLVVLGLLVAVAAGFFLRELGRSSQDILADNYRSVLALERMKEALERLDSAALLAVAGRPQPAEDAVAAYRRRFENELAVQEGNITEPGEGEETARLRGAWSEYVARFDAFRAAVKTGAGAQEEYGERLQPAFVTVKDALDRILGMNQDAMVRKSQRAKRLADRSTTWLIALSLIGFAVALYASSTITSRLVRPLSVLAQATRRIAQGDLAARAQVQGKDELARLAADFNAMAERLQKYRASSLGELLEAQRAAQAAIDSLPDPVLVVSVTGELVQLNAAAEGVLQVTLERGLAALDGPVRAVVDRVREHTATGKGSYLPRGLDESLRVTTHDGDRWFLPRAMPVYAEEGNVAGTTLVLQDVTRLLRFEELRNNVVATVAHEFRTPLTSLRMAIHLLSEQGVGPLTEKQADLVYAAREDCERLQSIVDDLLDLSRIQAGRLELSAGETDAEALVRDAVAAQLGVAAQRDVKLVGEVLPGTGLVLADADRVQLVFANLITNAVRHSPAGGTVTVRARDEDGAVRFEVVDRGPGIPSEYHHAIFQKYFQMPGAPSGGAGLGLFIASEIVQAHHGTIGVDSEPGEGSTFWFRLPRP